MWLPMGSQIPNAKVLIRCHEFTETKTYNRAAIDESFSQVSFRRLESQMANWRLCEGNAEIGCDIAFDGSGVALNWSTRCGNQQLLKRQRITLRRPKNAQKIGKFHFACSIDLLAVEIENQSMVVDKRMHLSK